jgi:hypothetical protein
MTGMCLRQDEHIRVHVWYRYSLTCNQVVVATHYYKYVQNKLTSKSKRHMMEPKERNHLKTENWFQINLFFFIFPNSTMHTSRRTDGEIQLRNIMHLYLNALIIYMVMILFQNVSSNLSQRGNLFVFGGVNVFGTQFNILHCQCIFTNLSFL